ncbi:RNA polymerase sigma factor (sigma-70 family) [Saccharopolyspora lacisalsi]|uniref:RNA polymerase sigma factor (Sigma-70 family) n=1 Tax=Halosaccharopolyspora lacisalsi TaxID=1000566 RepID=A0A839E3H7_9PSEU|nr:sigma-70 family RNA polymerase sigma factor [Halosaccharopolyspora lacisalsi]MBA8825478.1 RNA polymerase sigma factor (sigma-70 family) [Halosaccharopolyspora lacisalsi]
MDEGDDALAAEFDRHRPNLLRAAYRLTARPADAEDAVQEAWRRLMRLAEAHKARIGDLGAWLTTVVGHICLDHMRSAAVRRESYVGPWLPEPVVGEVDGQARDPLDVVVDHEDLRFAALPVLHELTPEQRLAFVLHDGFDTPFAEIADVLGCTAATARQHASRGRRAMTTAGPPPRIPMPEQQRVPGEFLAAVSARDVAAVARVLHPRAARPRRQRRQGTHRAAPGGRRRQGLPVRRRPGGEVRGRPAQRHAPGTGQR